MLCSMTFKTAEMQGLTLIDATPWKDPASGEGAHVGSSLRNQQSPMRILKVLKQPFCWNPKP